VVTARTAYEKSDTGFTKNPTIPASAVAAVRRVPQAGTAIGDLTNDSTKILERDGTPIGDGPYFASAWTRRPRASSA
jgi:hypothetical protein